MIPAIELISLVIVIIIDFHSSVRTNEIITSYNYLISSNSLFEIFKATQGYKRKLRWCQPFLHSPHRSINLTSKSCRWIWSLNTCHIVHVHPLNWETTLKQTTSRTHTKKFQHLESQVRSRLNVCFVIPFPEGPSG